MIKILAIDDTNDNLVTLAGWLSYAFPDAQIITTLSGREGIAQALSECPDLILLDLVMPIMDGIETCKKLKENQLSKHIPVIMLTGFKTDSTIRTKAYQAGVQAFLSKPIEEDELVAQVSSIIRNKNAEHNVQLENVLNKEKLRIRAQKFDNELKKLNCIRDQSTASIIITDQDGYIVNINSQVCKTTGYSVEELLGKNPSIFQSGETPIKTYNHFWSSIISGKEWHGELKNKKKNGELFWESITIFPIFNEEGKIINFLGVKEDITEKKTMKANIAEAAKYKEDSKLFKTAFLSNISHEIRTPLNGILGFSELLKEPKLTGEEQQEYIRIIEKSSAQMLNIINDIVIISNIESGQCNVYISELNIHEQVESIYHDFKSEVEEKGLGFTFKHKLPTNEAKVKTDTDKLVSILTNLIKNAIQYTTEGSIEFGYKIVYTIREPYIQFFVRDTGIGISKDRQEAIFECFVQADIANKMANQGAGLGLAIAKAYVEMLGGNIWVESNQRGDKHGSCFYFTIPFSGRKLALKTNANVNFKSFSE